MDQQCERQEVDPNAGPVRRDLNSKSHLNHLQSKGKQTFTEQESDFEENAGNENKYIERIRSEAHA